MIHFQEYGSNPKFKQSYEEYQSKASLESGRGSGVLLYAAVGNCHILLNLRFHVHMCVCSLDLEFLIILVFF